MKRVYKPDSHPKKLYPCPICGTGMRGVKSWTSVCGVRKQRVECENAHRLTLNIEITPDPVALHRMLRRANVQF